jgi:excisionase family DNA binding protein
VTDAPRAADDLLVVAEVARALRISRSLAYRLCTDGTIPSARIASVGGGRGRLVVRRADVDRYVERIFAERPASPPKINVDAVVRRVRRRHG